MSTLRRQPAVPDIPRVQISKPTAHTKKELADDRPIRRESRITLGGLVYIGVTMFLAIGAINSQNNLLFWLFGVAIATLVVSGLFSGNALMKLRIESFAVADCYAGQESKLRYILRSRSKFFPIFAALISEIQPRKSKGAFASDCVPASVIHLAPSQMLEVTGTMIPHQRGRHSLRRFRLSTRFPFGLLQKSLVFESPRVMLVLPHQLRLRPGLLRRVRSKGELVRKRSIRGGQSNEFWGLREYRPGDTRRCIAWKHSARRDGLVVVEHAQTISSRIWIWIDEQEQLGAWTNQARERSIALAAALLEEATSQGTPVGLWIARYGVRIQPRHGRAHRGRCMRTLAMLDLNETIDTSAPPPVSERDQLIIITRGERARKADSSALVLDLDRPDQWLRDPGSLPTALAEPG